MIYPSNLHLIFSDYMLTTVLKSCTWFINIISDVLIKDIPLLFFRVCRVISAVADNAPFFVLNAYFMSLSLKIKVNNSADIVNTE